MKDKNKILEWIVAFFVVIVMLIVVSKISEVLEINRRAARYLIIAVVFIVWYFVDLIRNRKK